ncbi:MAG: DUF1292 domain-containing protein [Bacilli bacterium]|jgi:uncharacterized protein YrzB (UPF0473 family)
MTNKDRQITIIDEDGKEYNLEILFTYENEERKQKYVFFFDPENDEEVMYARYFDDGRLEYIEDEEEQKECEEVFNAFDFDELTLED